jgi:hypothetical protein
MKLFQRTSVGGKRAKAVGLVLSAGLLLPLGTIAAGAFAAAPASASITHDAANGSTYHAVQPYRLADTRTNSGFTNSAGQTLTAGRVLTIGVAPSGIAPNNVPHGATAVVVNITAIDPTSPGYLTAYAAGQTVPSASTVNFVAGQTVANEAAITLGNTGDPHYGQISIYNFTGSTDVAVDVEGYYSPDTSGSFYVPAVNFNKATLSTAVSPTRVLDTRAGSGQQGAGETLGPDQSLSFYPGTTTFVPGVLSPIVPSSATAVVLNVTATDATDTSYLTVWSAGGAQPLASNLNFLAGQTVPNRVIVPINPVTKQVSIFNSSGNTDVVVDLDGYYTPDYGTEYYGLVTPTRIADTRSGSGLPYSGQTLGQGSIQTINVPADTFGPDTGFNAPANFLGVDANITVTDTTDLSYLTVYPSTAGSSPPLASDLNWVAGQSVASGDQISGVGVSTPSTAIDVYNNAGSADVIVELYGYFAGGVAIPPTAQ